MGKMDEVALQLFVVILKMVDLSDRKILCKCSFTFYFFNYNNCDIQCRKKISSSSNVFTNVYDTIEI